MKRPLLIILIGSLIGIILGLYEKSMALFVIIISLLYLIFYKSKYKILLDKIYFIIFILSIVIFNIYTLAFIQKYTVKLSENIEIIGVIRSDVKIENYSNEYTIEVKNINGEKQNEIYMKFKSKILYEYGTKLKIKGEFIKPQVQRNYRGFDYSMYLKTKKIIGTIKEKESEIIKNKENININEIIWKIKEFIKNSVYNNLEKNNADLLIGLLIGDKENLSEDIEESFRINSLSHILAVSGSHVTYILVLFNITKKLIGYKKSKIVTLLFLLFFVQLVGGTASVTRACIMTGLIIISKLLLRQSDMINQISLSAIIILIINPLNLIDIGFILSYAGTIGIIIGNKYVSSIIPESRSIFLNKCRELIIMCISANILIIPITIIYFHTFSLTFVLTNLILGSIIGIAIIIGFIAIFLPFLYLILDPILSIIINLSSILQYLPFSQILVPMPNIIIFFIYYVYICQKLYLFDIKNRIHIYTIQKKMLCHQKQFCKILLILTILIILIDYIPMKKDLEIHCIDVGQGDSTLIITPNEKNILIDGGGSEDYDVGNNTLIPYLLSIGIYKIDIMIISHFDTDHVMGLIEVAKSIDVDRIIIGKQKEEYANLKLLKEIIKEKNIKINVVKKGDIINIEKNINLYILWPKTELIGENAINNNSLVAKLTYKRFSMLFTGDIEAIAEEEILEIYKNTDILKCDVIKVPHHGSKGSSTEKFIEKVKPQIATISSSENNIFGHPSEVIINRLKEKKIKIFRTDKNGEISLYISEDGKIKTKCKINV